MKYICIFILNIFIFSQNTFSTELNLVMKKEIMGTVLNVYQVTQDNFIFQDFLENSEYKKIKKEENIGLFSKGNSYYYVGNTVKNMTAFILQGENQFLVDFIGKVAYKKLLAIAEGDEYPEDIQSD